MANLDEQELLAFVYHAQSLGCEIFRVGAQTDGWAGHVAIYLAEAAGPAVGTAAWRENIVRLFDVTSRVPGVYLQVIPTFTHKHESFQRNMQIAKSVVAIQQAGSPDDPTPYRHIVWEAWNEVKHPITHDSNRKMSNIKKMLAYLKNETGLPVGTDYDLARGEDWVGEYPRTLVDHVDYIALHPPRNDWHGSKCKNIRPSYWQIRKTVNRYAGKPVWIEEPTCYISDESKADFGITTHGHYALCGGGTEQQRQKVIGDYMWDTEKAGAVWFTHASWLFSCRKLGWLPQ
jgi:hypothetical protein